MLIVPIQIEFQDRANNIAVRMFSMTNWRLNGHTWLQKEDINYKYVTNIQNMSKYNLMQILNSIPIIKTGGNFQVTTMSSKKSETW